MALKEREVRSVRRFCRCECCRARCARILLPVLPVLWWCLVVCFVFGEGATDVLLYLAPRGLFFSDFIMKIMFGVIMRVVKR